MGHKDQESTEKCPWWNVTGRGTRKGLLFYTPGHQNPHPATSDECDSPEHREQILGSLRVLKPMNNYTEGSLSPGGMLDPHTG